MLDLEPDCAATFVYKNSPRKLTRRTTTNIEGGDLKLCHRGCRWQCVRSEGVFGTIKCSGTAADDSWQPRWLLEMTATMVVQGDCDQGDRKHSETFNWQQNSNRAGHRGLAKL
jgi:hypothetical protein